MGKSRWGGESAGVRKDTAGRVFIPTKGGRQYLETAAPTDALHGNPGFEDETAGVPDVWNFFWESGVTDVSSETVAVYSGDASLRVHIEAGGGFQLVMSDVVELQSLGTVGFSTFACKDLGSPTIRLGVLTAPSGTPDFFDGVSTYFEDPLQSLTADWERYSRRVRVPGGHTVGRLFFRIAPAATEAATVYLDLTTSEVLAPAVADTGWVAPTYETGFGPWSDVDENEQPMVRRLGESVRLVGLFRRTSGSSITPFVLAEEFRPSRYTWRTCVVAGVPGVCFIDPDGVVTISGSWSTGDFISLDVSYDINQP